MATVVPPPSKRRRTELAELSEQQQNADRIPSDAGSVRVQFKDQESGEQVGASILVPLERSGVENLEQIYQSLSNQVGLCASPTSDLPVVSDYPPSRARWPLLFCDSLLAPLLLAEKPLSYCFSIRIALYFVK